MKTEFSTKKKREKKKKKRSEVFGWVDHLASQEDLLFLYKLTMQNIEEFLLRKHCKEGASVVTHFWTPRARDNVYLFRTKCKSVAHIAGKLTKMEREIFIYLFIYLFFSRNPVWAVFCSLYPSPLLPKSSGFLRLTRGLHNAKFFPLLSCF
jgi:hypothetical protein